MNQNNKIEKDFSVIILAAGKSERLGFPKLSLKYNRQYTFIEQIAHEYKVFGCEEINLVVNKVSEEYIRKHNLKFLSNFKLIINEHPEWHRFYSLKIGVKGLIKQNAVFVHNVDNPFVSPQVLKQLLEKRNLADYIIPECNGRGGHPILISDKIINDIRATEEDQVHMKEFLNQYSRLKIPVKDEKVLVNINTIGEYKRYFDFNIE